MFSRMQYNMKSGNSAFCNIDLYDKIFGNIILRAVDFKLGFQRIDWWKYIRKGAAEIFGYLKYLSSRIP